MMYKKYLVVALLSLMFIDCREKKSNINIKGNWYLYSLDSVMGKPKINYDEFFFDDNTMYRFSSVSGFLNPIFYQVSKDSLFYGELNQIDFIGKLNFKSKDTLLVSHENDTLVLYNLVDEKNLMSDYLNIDVTIEKKIFKKFGESLEEKFLTHFFIRMNRCYKSVVK